MALSTTPSAGAPTFRNRSSLEQRIEEPDRGDPQGMSSSVAERVAAIRRQIQNACATSDRTPTDITLIGACKRQPVERLLEAHQAGLRNFGENIVQEALLHRDHLPSNIEWHLIGPLQSNKANKAAAAFTWIHSIDRPKIAHVLERAARKTEVRIHGLLEINLGQESSKHGFRAEELTGEIDELADLEHIRIEGLMAIPPFEADAAESRRWFRRLRQLRDDLFSRQPWENRPGYLSMGMSSDFQIAIEEGATHVRVGTSLFGTRTLR
jgi:pyridoxal phosphate enzyme (YggS family)